ncbi:hypothetical protein [Streptomyces sp. MMG1121]|uniref:hypothetical protein n=1 Tax=Streptomyces sp. MMG1121 TaxID=1415544 RepID=UPI00131C7123|nr:hypothetical protein [Streptomyces sp. MMG1121]
MRELTRTVIIALVLAGAGQAPAAWAADSGGAAATGGVVFAPATSHRGSTMLSACRTIEQPPGPLATLGLGSENPSVAMACVPAAVSSR